MPSVSMWCSTTALILLGTVRAATGSAADVSSCTAPTYRQLDFRLGSFRVTTASGQRAGVALVEAVLNGCMLVEFWAGAAGGSGRAHYYYDRNADLWRFMYVNDEGATLAMTGQEIDGAMVFTGVNDFSGMRGLHRMTWKPLPDRRVSQLWELSLDAGASWKRVFHGLYARDTPALR
jgi:hypothetical protein